MTSLGLISPLRSILCLGAHSDDIEIGCGGTILRLIEADPQIQITWIVFSAAGVRSAEASRSADCFLSAATDRIVRIENFRDGFFPWNGDQIKEYFESLKQQVNPGLIFTHFRNDLHQDHRTISELTWNTFRDHLILEYEIPKYDADLGAPNLFVDLQESHCRDKTTYLMDCFASQHAKRWFRPETFQSLMCIRGVECGSHTGYAEAFYARKLVMKPNY